MKIAAGASSKPAGPTEYLLHYLTHGDFLPGIGGVA